jgi:5-methylcytosine-specific restriction endonuclease McrA
MVKMTDEERRIKNLERSRRYRAEYPEKVKEINRKASAKYYAENKEKVAAGIADWKTKNKERSLATTRTWQTKNIGRMKAAQDRYVANHPEKVQAKGKKWRDANSEWLSQYRKLNTGKIRIYAQNRRAKIRANGGALSFNITQKLFVLQRGLCPCCKQPLGENYHLDHIMPVSRGGPNIDENMQLLRQSCNNQKHAKDPVTFMQSKGFLI